MGDALIEEGRPLVSEGEGKSERWRDKWTNAWDKLKDKWKDNHVGNNDKKNEGIGSDGGGGEGEFEKSDQEGGGCREDGPSEIGCSSEIYPCSEMSRGSDVVQSGEAGRAIEFGLDSEMGRGNEFGRGIKAPSSEASEFPDLLEETPMEALAGVVAKMGVAHDDEEDDEWRQVVKERLQEMTRMRENVRRMERETELARSREMQRSISGRSQDAAPNRVSSDVAGEADANILCAMGAWLITLISLLAFLAPGIYVLVVFPNIAAGGLPIFFIVAGAVGVVGGAALTPPGIALRRAIKFRKTAAITESAGDALLSTKATLSAAGEGMDEVEIAVMKETKVAAEEQKQVCVSGGGDIDEKVFVGNDESDDEEKKKFDGELDVEDIHPESESLMEECRSTTVQSLVTEWTDRVAKSGDQKTKALRSALTGGLASTTTPPPPEESADLDGRFANRDIVIASVRRLPNPFQNDLAHTLNPPPQSAGGGGGGNIHPSTTTSRTSTTSATIATMTTTTTTATATKTTAVTSTSTTITEKEVTPTIDPTPLTSSHSLDEHFLYRHKIESAAEFLLSSSLSADAAVGITTAKAAQAIADSWSDVEADENENVIEEEDDDEEDKGDLGTGADKESTLVMTLTATATEAASKLLSGPTEASVDAARSMPKTTKSATASTEADMEDVDGLIGGVHDVIGGVRDVIDGVIEGVSMGLVDEDIQRVSIMESRRSFCRVERAAVEAAAATAAAEVAATKVEDLLETVSGMQSRGEERGWRREVAEVAEGGTVTAATAAAAAADKAAEAAAAVSFVPIKSSVGRSNAGFVVETAARIPAWRWRFDSATTMESTSSDSESSTPSTPRVQSPPQSTFIAANSVLRATAPPFFPARVKPPSMRDAGDEDPGFGSGRRRETARRRRRPGEKRAMDS